MTRQFRRLLALSDPAAAGPAAAGQLGAKAARLAAALRAGLPVLPGWAVPVSEGRAAAQAGAGAVAAAGMPAGRRAVLGRPLDPPLAAELRAAVLLLGGRVIVRSSSPLEGDARWSGAFSSVAEVGPDDVATAVRSCWAAAFAVDPLERLAACGLPPAALELGLVIQAELRPDAGGVARVTGSAASGQARAGQATEVSVEGVAGHPGALLSGWSEGAGAQVRLPPATAGRAAPAQPAVSDSGLAALLGRDLIAAVASLAATVCRELGDNMIEWAAVDGVIWLLQSLRSTPVPGVAAPAAAARPERAAVLVATPPPAPAAGAGPAGRRPVAAGLAGWAGQADPADPGLAEAAAAAFRAPGAAAGSLAARQWMPLLAAVTQAQGQHVPGRPAAPGTAAGRLVRCRPHERPEGGGTDAILLVDRPLPALAPLLFGARGVIARAGAAGSHLAEVARSLGVPMVIGCRPDEVLGEGLPGRDWIAAIDGGAGDVALLPAS